MMLVSVEEHRISRVKGGVRTSRVKCACVDLTTIYAPKRRVWKEEQKVKSGFSMYIPMARRQIEYSRH
jgi:hypothetical protein